MPAVSTTILASNIIKKTKIFKKIGGIFGKDNPESDGMRYVGGKKSRDLRKKMLINSMALAKANPSNPNSAVIIELNRQVNNILNCKKTGGCSKQQEKNLSGVMNRLRKVFVNFVVISDPTKNQVNRSLEQVSPNINSARNLGNLPTSDIPSRSLAFNGLNNPFSSNKNINFGIIAAIIVGIGFFVIKK